MWFIGISALGCGVVGGCHGQWKCQENWEDLNSLLLQKMSEQCVNSFDDSLEDLIENSEMVAPDFTSDEEALSILEKYARTLINGKTGQI